MSLESRHALRHRVVRIAIFSSVAVALAMTGPLADDNPYRLKSGARGTVCLDCHGEFSETMSKRSVHTPVKAGDCTDCHSPHAADHGKLLASDPGAICMTCHESMTSDAPKSVHQVVAEGQCTACHDPHASDHDNALIERGNDLCFSCHEDVATAIQDVAFPHAPVSDDCISCHDPHASDVGLALLRESDGELCTGCHDPSQPALVKDHRGYPVADGRCSSCHNPHGSDNRGILWANVHQPVANGKCILCHFDGGAPNALEVKKPGYDGCRSCHAELTNAALASGNVHWPVLDDTGCLNCHGPHATRERKLLKAEPKALCGDCHGDTMARQARSVSKHAPAEDGECSSCHDPHGSEFEFLATAQSQFELCGACHDWEGHSAHPIGETAIDPRNPNLSLDCSSCHRMHGTEHQHFAAFDVKRGLCVECHSGMRR